MKNTLVWIDANGEISQRYQKVHLFDLDLGEGSKMKESDTIEAGNEILPPFETPFGKLGLMICFDVRQYSSSSSSSSSSTTTTLHFPRYDFTTFPHILLGSCPSALSLTMDYKHSSVSQKSHYLSNARKPTS